MAKERIIWIAALAVAAVVIIALAAVLIGSNTDAEQTLSAPAYGYNVKDYGAVGDGVVDDGAAILATVAAAQGAVVYFPTGTYYVANPATLPTNWPAGWKGASPDGSWIKTAVTAIDNSTSWDFRWIEP
jgi:hypothetical protein